jgi:hypothetical protein
MQGKIYRPRLPYFSTAHTDFITTHVGWIIMGKLKAGLAYF